MLFESLQEGPGLAIKQKCTGFGNGGGGCGALLEVEREDIYLTSHTDITGETDYFYTFRCPCCSNETDIPEKNIPPIIRRNLFNQRRMTLSR